MCTSSLQFIMVSPSPFCTLHFSQECFGRELIVTEPHTPTSFCRCLVAGVCVALR